MMFGGLIIELYFASGHLITADNDVFIFWEMNPVGCLVNPLFVNYPGTGTKFSLKELDLRKGHGKKPSIGCG